LVASRVAGKLKLGHVVSQGGWRRIGRKIRCGGGVCVCVYV
jgi:hypothetical protein